MPLSTWIFLYCSSAFFGAEAVPRACALAGDCAFATSITTPPTTRNAITPKANASFLIIDQSLIEKCRNKKCRNKKCRNSVVSAISAALLRDSSFTSRLITVHILPRNFRDHKLLRQEPIYFCLFVRRHKQEYPPAPRPVALQIPIA